MSEFRTKNGELSFPRMSRARARGPAGQEIDRLENMGRGCEMSSVGSPVPSGSDSTLNVILIPYCSSHLLSKETMTSGR
jgi:hypothetical protein